MGIRINKAIGWAMPCPEDPLDREDGIALEPLSVHAEWLQARAASESDEELRSELEFNATALHGERGDLGDCAVWTPELDGGTLIVLPPDYARLWHRTDDDLDFAFRDDDASFIDYHNWNFHPFGGLWMDDRTGERLNQHAATLMRRNQAGRVADDADRLDRLARIVRPEGTPSPGPYRNFADAVGHIVPCVPDTVRRVAEQLGLFDRPNDVLALRPARAVWWE